MLSEWSLLLMSYGMALAAVGTLFALVFGGQTATYGRYSAQTIIPVTARVAWFVQELPSLCLGAWTMWLGGGRGSWVNVVVVGMFTLHYMHRTLIYPLLIRGGKDTPVHIVVAAALFCTYNGYLQSVYHNSYANYSTEVNPTARRAIGLALFLVGLAINLHSDHILRNLRKPGETGYKIPRGGLFDYVSGANFLGEMIEWTGYALVANSVPAWSFALFTACNVGPRAIAHHKWYKHKFDDYPVHRRALLPFIL